MTDEQPASEPARVNQLDRVKQEYTQAAREILQRSMRGPEGYTLFSYAAVKAWADAANKAKSTDAAAVAKALRTGKYDSAVGVLDIRRQG